MPSNFIKIDMKDYLISDLLQREITEIDTSLQKAYISGKTVLVTGAAGYIGGELSRQLLNLNPEKLILIDQAESAMFELENELSGINPNINIAYVIADVTNFERVQSIFRSESIQIVYHAAAYKHVPLMEKNIPEAILTNVLGTKNILDLSIAFAVDQFVLISTDKAIKPKSIMGKSKKIAEYYVQIYQDLPIKTSITRFGNILGSTGSVEPLFKKQIANGGPITITHPDMERYFLTATEACQMVLETTTYNESNKTYIFEMGSPVNIVDLAKRMVDLSQTGFEQIEFEITGIRTGEKINEDLIEEGQKMISTTSETIFKVAYPDIQNKQEVLSKIDKLIKDVYVHCDVENVFAIEELIGGMIL